MRSGKFRDKITIQKRTSTQDGFGQPVDVWTDIVNDFGFVEPVRGREFFSYATVGADIDTIVRMRYWPDIKAAQRILVQNRVLDIQHAIYDQKKRQLEILCKEAG